MASWCCPHDIASPPIAACGEKSAGDGAARSLVHRIKTIRLFMIRPKQDPWTQNNSTQDDKRTLTS